MFALLLTKFFLFFVTLLLFFQPFLFRLGLRLLVAFQFSKHFHLFAEGLGGAVQSVGEIVLGVTEGLGVIGGIGIGRLLDSPLLVKLFGAHLKNLMHSLAHVPPAIILILDPVLQIFRE